MLYQKILEQTRIQPVDIPQSVLCRVACGNSQAQRRISNGKSEVDEQNALVGFLGQRDSNIAGDCRYARSALGAGENVQSSNSPRSGQSFLAERSFNPGQSLTHSVVLERQM